MQLICADVFPFAFREPIKKYRSFFDPIRHKHAITAGASLPTSCDALLNQAAAKVRINQTDLRSIDGFAEARIGDPFMAGKSRQAFCLEYLQTVCQHYEL